MEGERRRHARSGSVVSARLEVLGAALAVARIVDLSAGGALVEIDAGTAPPPLGARARATLLRGGRSIVREGRVVRVRWTGRDRGQPLPPAVALVFDDGEDAAHVSLLEQQDVLEQGE
ncbi:MAG: PilZ domain-containing protein [Deltaproteobacteria bacterium]|nr:PilZ domain-containing protein [Deltaproteobacteria bacterium]